MTPDAAVAGIAAPQLGLITRQQARRAGLTDHAMASRLATGRWRRVRPRVFAIEGCSPTCEQEVLAARLSASAVASWLTAARFWGLRLPPPASIDVLTSDDRRVRLPGGFEPLGSPRERWVLRALDAVGIPRPVPQFRVPGTRYRLDFAHPELLAGLEYDGWDGHSSRSAFDGDRRRWRRLTTLGWRLVVFTSTTAAELVVDVSRLLAVSGRSRGA